MNQQQYQQAVPQQQDNQYYIPPQKKKTTLAVGLIIVVLIGAFGVYFLMKPRLDLAASPDMQSPTNIFEMSNLKICDSIDANFNCQENLEKTIARGNNFYLYAQITKNNKNKDTQIKFQEGMKIVDENNNILYYNENFKNVSTTFPNSGVNILNLKVPMSTSINNKAGKTIIYLTLKDMVTKQTITKTIENELI